MEILKIIDSNLIIEYHIIKMINAMKRRVAEGKVQRELG
ncbi:Hypothetical protein CCH01_000870 [Clostridium chauvoei JF4335]|nr:Hypothetical protein CCH01_000870 [Clostridium chauvoei JF4335]